MRICLVMVLVMAACGGKKADPPAAGRGSGSTGLAEGSGSAGSASAPAPGYCITNDPGNQLAVFVADDQTATFCVRTEQLEPPSLTTKCTTVELATGTYREAEVPPAGPVRAYEVQQDETGVQICKRAVCTKLELPKPTKLEEGEELERYSVAVSNDGKRAAATGGSLEGLVLLDATTGKKQKTVAVGTGDYQCVEPPAFVGERIYVSANVCAGPGSTGYLFSADGTQIGTVDKINVYGSDPTPLGGNLYAFVDFGGGTVEIVDVVTGKDVRVIEVKRPDDCDGCDVLGDASGWQVSPLAVTPSGKLVTIGATINVIDPAGKVEQMWRLPVCAEPTQ